MCKNKQRNVLSPAQPRQGVSRQLDAKKSHHPGEATCSIRAAPTQDDGQDCLGETCPAGKSQLKLGTH